MAGPAFPWDLLWGPRNALPPGRPGDPGLFGPRSQVWRVARERALLAGGPAALLLQVAHPLVAEGVICHSGYREDPYRRLRATVGAVLAISFGDREQARAAAGRVARVHRRVRGTLRRPTSRFPAGTPYMASDPGLAMWVHASLLYTAMETYALLIHPLTEEGRARYYQEAKAFARLFGVTDQVLPPDHRDFISYFARMLEGGDLAVGDETRAIAHDVLRPPFPGPLRLFSSTIRVLTAGLLPAGLREAFALPWGAAERASFRLARATTAGSIQLLPPFLRYWPHYRVALRRVREHPVQVGRYSPGRANVRRSIPS